MRILNIMVLSLLLSSLVSPSATAQPYYRTMRILHAIEHADWKCHSNSTETSCYDMKYCSWHKETCGAEKELVINDHVKDISPLKAVVLLAAGSSMMLFISQF